MSEINKKIMHSAVESAQNVCDLLPMLNQVPLDTIKQFMNALINEMTPSAVTKMKYGSLPIDEIIPENTIQHILSFHPIDGGNIRSVNKQWQKLSDMNEKNYYSKLIHRVDQHSTIPYNKDLNKTCIMHPKRKILTRVEQELGFKGPANILSVGNDGNHPNDRYFFHPGHYRNSNALEKNCSLVGIYGSVDVTVSGSEPLSIGILSEFIRMINFDMNKYGNINVYAENIKFDCPIDVDVGSKLWLRNCRIIGDKKEFGNRGIKIERKLFLHTDNCQYMAVTPAIEISQDADTVTIQDSVFINCGGEGYGYHRANACIEIKTVDTDSDGDRGSVKLKCNGNVFEDNYGYPIAESAGETYVESVELYELRDNILKGENAKHVRNKGDLTDANRIYHGKHIFK